MGFSSMLVCLKGYKISFKHMLRYTLFTEQHNCCNPIASDVQKLLEKMVFGFFKKSGPSPEEEKKFQGAFFRRLINEDREKNNEEKIVDHCVLAGNFVFNDVMNAAAVSKHRKDLENDWNRFELAILFMFLTRYGKTAAELLGLDEMQVAQVCLETPSELLLGFCGACPNLSLDTLFADFKMIDSAAQKKYGNEKLENGYKHAFMLRMSDLNDDGKTSDGRE